MNIYLFYLKNSNHLYAYTSKKEYRDTFLLQRNPKCFRVAKLHIGQNGFRVFCNNYRNMSLTVAPLNTDITNYIDMVVTNQEITLLNEECDKLDNKMQELAQSLNNIDDIDSKHLESINYLTKTTYYEKNPDGTKDLMSTISLLSVFTHLFKNTFYESEE